MGSKRHVFAAIECVSVVQESRSSKVDHFVTNRKRICDFLLIRHRNHSPILHMRLRRPIGWKLRTFSYPALILRPRSVCPHRNFAVKLAMGKLESWGHLPVEIDRMIVVWGILTWRRIWAAVAAVH